jgi:hypothetical protein
VSIRFRFDQISFPVVKNFADATTTLTGMNADFETVGVSGPMRTIDIDATATFVSPVAGSTPQNMEWATINHSGGSFDIDLSAAKELAEWIDSQLEPGVTELSRACETSLGTIALKFSVVAASSFVRAYRNLRRARAA